MPPTKEQLEKFEEEERKEIYTEATRELRKKIEELEEMKLGKTEGMLLGKLIDFTAVWDYDSVQIRRKLYELFFDWSDLNAKVTMDPGEKKDGKGKEDGAEDRGAIEEGQSQANNADAEQDKEERKKR